MPQNQSAIRYVKIAIGIVASVTAAAFALPFLYFTFRFVKSDCTLARAIESIRYVGSPNAGERIRKTRAIIQSDPGAGLNLVRTSNGTYWVPIGTELPLTTFLGQQAERIYGDAVRGVHAGDIVLDCGANVGVYTRIALDTGAKLVVAIEPAPDNLESLRRNFAPEIQAGKVILYPKGVWNKDEVLTFHVFPHNSGADSLFAGVPNSQSNVIQVPLTTIDNLVDELHLPRVDFIKMDIKGAAPQALTGAQRTLAKFHPRMAVSTEEPLDAPSKIRGPIRSGWPNYREECGQCFIFREGFFAQVMFYR